MLAARTLSEEDAALVQAYLQGTRGKREAGQLRHHRAFAAAAFDDAQGTQVVGYLALDDSPAVCNASSLGSSPAATAEAATAAAEGLGYKQASSLYVQQLQAEEGPVLQQLLQHAFVSMPHIKQVLLLSTLDLDADIMQQQQAESAQASGVPDTAAMLFNKATRVADTGPWLYECSRQVVLPTLACRHARVEDHDDLLPIVAAAAAGPCPSLAALPQSCDPEQPFALTRLIGSQDSENLVLVAEDEGGKLVGLLVATLQLDVSLLMQSFELGFCDAFMPPEVYEECEAAARQAAADKVQQQQQPDAAAAEEDPSSSAAAGASSTPGPSAEDIRQELVPLLLQAFAKRQQQQRQQQRKQSKAASAGAAAAAAGTPVAPHTLAAITMLCMQPGYEDRSIDFMPALFAELPQQDYCALTLPHSATQPQLARHMTLLRPVPGMHSFPQVVLLLHRASLALHMGADWEVRLAVPDDVMALHGLVGSMSSAMSLQEAFLHAVGRQGAVVASINGELVGMLATSPVAGGTLQAWSRQFRLQGSGCSSVQAGAVTAAAQQHGLIEACVLNPVFSAQAGALLSGALRLLGKQELHYVLGPTQPAPAEMLAVMQQQPSRRGRVLGSQPKSQQQAAAADAVALFSFSKGMAYAPQYIVHAQIVVAGASQTGLACLERLLLQPHTRFTSITLLAPGGIHTDSIAGQLSAAHLARLGLHANVTVVDSHLVALDTQQQLLALADGQQLPYDLLAVTTGVQDQLGPAVAGAFPDVAHFVLSAQQLLASSITPQVADTLRSVLVYGADLHAFDVLGTLISAGVNADAITWVCPGGEQEAPSLSLLRGLAARLGVELPEPQQGRLLDLTPNPDGTRAVAALQALDSGDEDGPLQQMELDLLVGCGSLQPSAVVASCLASGYIVWDGRLVVDSQFCSSNAAIMGAGPVAKFSRRYTLPEVRQEHHNSCELGGALADAIARRFSTAAAAGGAEAATALQELGDELPSLQQCKVQGCRLPSGHVFLHGGCPAAVERPALTPPPGGCSLISTSGDKSAVLTLCLDACSNIHLVAFMGSEGAAGAAADVLQHLVGLPFSFVAAGLRLPDSLSEALANGSDVVAGLTADPQGVWVMEQDMLALLHQPWAQLLFHEDFGMLRQLLLAAAAGSEQEEGRVDSSVAGVVLNFMQQGCRAAELPGYQVHVPSAESC